MNPLSTPVRYWTFASSIPVAVDGGHLTVGGAVDADTGERLTALRVFGAKELVGEYWLTEEETVELAVRLLAMEQWHRPEVAEPCGAGSGERE